MAEKRVSVRLAAVGGKQVRAEFEGIGEAGKRGFGKASREMEIANARLARFARRAKIAAGIMAAAAVAAGVAMVRSGLKTIDEQAKLAASLNTTTASLQVLARAADLAGVSQSEVEQATIMMTKSLSQAAAGTGPAVKALNALNLSAADLAKLPIDEKMAAIQDAIAKFIPKAEQAAVASQIFGSRAGLIFTRIDSTTLRQATQDVQDFGVAVSESDAAQIQRTNDALSRMGLLWRGISNQLAVVAAPALEAIANAMAAIGKTTGPLGRAIKSLFNHIGEIATIAATFAAVLGGRLVLSLASAALGIRGVSLSLAVLKGALIRTGIGALIVGAGELVYWFGRLVAGAGGIGNALGLLKDVAVEVWDRIRMATAAAGAAATAMFYDLKADAASGMQSAIKSVVSFGNTAANTFEGAYEAIKSIWGLLPASIGDLAFQAANSLIEGVESMLNGVVARINGFIAGINAGLEALGSDRRITLIGDLELGAIENRFAGAAGKVATAAKTAFDKAFADAPLTVPDFGLTNAANKALETANTYRTAATDLANGATAPLASWQALKDAVSGTAADGAAALNDATAGAERLNESFKSVAGGAGKAANAVAAGWKAVSQSLAEYTKSAMNWGKGLGEAMTGALQGAESAFRQFVTTGKFDFKSLVSSILADLAVLAFRRNVLGPIANALSGLFGGGSVTAAVSHAGGMVGLPGPQRSVPALAFAGAPRLHAGGWAGLGPDEVPTILQRGERVLSRQEVARGAAGNASGGVSVHIDARGAQAGVAEQIDAKLRAAIPEIARIAKQSVADGRRRGQAL